MQQADVLIVGAGVVGLSLAYELADEGLRLVVIDRGPLGREASWAGAGILPPANSATARHPYDELRGLSFRLHAEWSRQLLAETGIDNGYRRCGAIYLSRSVGEAAALRGFYNTLQDEEIAAQRLSPEQLAEHEPALAAIAQSGRLKAAYAVPDECQIRNPRHLQALVEACRLRGVELLPETGAEAFMLDGERLAGIATSRGRISATSYCLTSGAWTQTLLAKLGVANGILPMKGQMLLYACGRPPFTAVINEGNRYLVARDDGHVLVGSTEEESGFDKSNTAAGLRDLQDFACDVIPALQTATLEQSWAGLRPASFDGLPYIGKIPGLQNAFVAAGHFRSGLYLSPGTAVVLSALVRGLTPAIDLHPFRLGRG